MPVKSVNEPLSPNMLGAGDHSGLMFHPNVGMLCSPRYLPPGNSGAATGMTANTWCCSTNARA